MSDASGDDENGGLSPGDAFKTITKALELVDCPLEEEVIINLDGSIENQQTYNENPDSDFGLVIRGLHCCGPDAGLTIQPTIWNQDNYEASQDPFDSGNPFDPETEKPCTINKVFLQDVAGVAFNGINFGWPGSTGGSSSPVAVGFSYGAAFYAEGVNQVRLRYCGFTRTMSGVKGYNNANLWIETCIANGCQSGVDLFHGSQAHIVGENSIKDAYYFGVRAAYKSQIMFRPHPLSELFTTKIYTEGALNNYSGVRAETGSDVILYEDDRSKFHELGMALVQILNLNEYTGPTYYGVSLASGSQLVGASKISFSVAPGEAKYNEGKPTIPEGRQKVVTDGSNGEFIE